MTTKRLRDIPYGNVKVRIYKNEKGEEYRTVLQSYATDVVEIDKNGWVFVNTLYSRTTRKHISAFCREYLPFDYYTLKQCYYEDTVINKNTGEVISRKEYENMV